MHSTLLLFESVSGTHRPDLDAHARFSCRIGRLFRRIAWLFS
jgi:hypothetical protein